YVDAMLATTRPPLWINLEYLSGEPWVESAHGLPSPQPRLPLTRYFFFPGFTERTGGLLRKAGLIEARDRARRHGRAPLPEPYAIAAPQAGVTISLFCYANLALPSLFVAWAQSVETVSFFFSE